PSARRVCRRWCSSAQARCSRHGRGAIPLALYMGGHPLFAVRRIMAFTEFSEQSQGVQLLQRSLARGRLGHAYLFTGNQIEGLEGLARTLAKTLNCLNPVRTNGVATDCCDACGNCRKIGEDVHADVHWARPESKSRVITIDQMRDLMQQVQLKPTEA